MEYGKLSYLSLFNVFIFLWSKHVAAAPQLENFGYWMPSERENNILRSITALLLSFVLCWLFSRDFL